MIDAEYTLKCDSCDKTLYKTTGPREEVQQFIEGRKIIVNSGKHYCNDDCQWDDIPF